jgi:hypothetical protein
MSSRSGSQRPETWFDTMLRGLALLAAPYLWTPELVDFRE